MTREEAADILIAAGPEDLTSNQDAARQTKARREALLAGDPSVIRAMLLTASPKNEITPDKLQEAVKVLGQAPAAG